eukprot:g3781.t1
MIKKHHPHDVREEESVVATLDAIWQGEYFEDRYMASRDVDGFSYERISDFDEWLDGRYLTDAFARDDGSWCDDVKEGFDAFEDALSYCQSHPSCGFFYRQQKNGGKYGVVNCNLGDIEGGKEGCMYQYAADISSCGDDCDLVVEKCHRRRSDICSLRSKEETSAMCEGHLSSSGDADLGTKWLEIWSNPTENSEPTCRIPLPEQQVSLPDDIRELWTKPSRRAEAPENDACAAERCDDYSNGIQTCRQHYDCCQWQEAAYDEDEVISHCVAKNNRDRRVVYGKDIDRCHAKDVVQLMMKHKNGDKTTCTGTIARYPMKKAFILTAAHCLKATTSEKEIQRVVVQFCDRNPSASAACPYKEKEFDSTYWTIHPEYVPAANDGDNIIYDVAVIRLSTSRERNYAFPTVPGVSKADRLKLGLAINKHHGLLKKGDKAFAVGYGNRVEETPTHVGTGSPNSATHSCVPGSDYLMVPKTMSNLTISGTETATRGDILGKSEGSHREELMCHDDCYVVGTSNLVGDRDPSIGKGDSGGPLLKNVIGKRRPRIFGVTSYITFSNDNLFKASVFARISEDVEDFIEENTLSYQCGSQKNPFAYDPLCGTDL